VQLEADRLMRQDSADAELRLAIAMSLAAPAPEDLSGALVRQDSAVSADGAASVASFLAAVLF
jgi:hypothetical protein